MRTKDFRREQNRLKDLRRRKLYRNRAINGRYEISDKEDDSVIDRNNPCCFGLWELSGSKRVIARNKLDNTTGHWQEYPKNHKYGSSGYNLKSSKHKKIRQAFKSKMKKEQNEI